MDNNIDSFHDFMTGFLLLTCGGEPLVGLELYRKPVVSFHNGIYDDLYFLIVLYFDRD